MTSYALLRINRLCYGLLEDMVAQRRKAFIKLIIKYVWVTFSWAIEAKFKTDKTSTGILIRDMF